MNILTRPLLTLQTEDDELIPLELPAISLTGRPKLVQELVAALPESLSLPQQRLVIQNILEQKAHVDPSTLIGEVVWNKRGALLALQHLDDEELREQEAITAEIEVLWKRRETVQETFYRRGEGLRKQIEEIDALLAFLVEESYSEPLLKAA
ncbi:MAG: hypothetical protein NTX57_16925 [Armatimonadetes bacterium]|nr:hypothetical protein [Armatimonadota bacterium]